MSTWSHARGTAARAADSKPLELLTRAGFIGYGIVHLLFAWLALQIAFGHPAGEGDQSGALQTLAAQPYGTVLIVAVVVGLVAMAIWQALEAAIGHRDEQGKRRIAERVGSVLRSAAYLYFAWTGVKVLQGANASNADSQQQTTAQLMDGTGGRFLVGFLGLVVVGIGVGLVVYGVKKSFERHLHTGRMSPKVRAASRKLGIAGYAAKGAAYGIVGVLLLTAAITYDAGKARGLDGAVRALAAQPYGTILLGIVAVGIAAFGVFCGVQARYRKV